MSTAIPDDLEARLSPSLRGVFRLELDAGNVIERVDVDMYSRCALAVIFKSPLHFEEIKARFGKPERITCWENRDGHYSIEAGISCDRTGHSIAGPIPT